MSSSRSAVGLDAYARPVAYASEHDRAAFLKRTALWTLGGLSIAGVVAAVSAVIVFTVPALLNRWVMMGVILGSFYMAQSVAAGMVHDNANKAPGFALGMVFQGIAMGYLILMATLMGANLYGGGVAAFAIIGQAGGLTGLTVLSMVGYLWTAPKDLSMIRGALSVMAVPMLVLMVVSFVFPIGGVLGILLSLVFVGVSGAGLLYQLNQVIHTMRTDQHVEGAYTISLGVLVLFWNLLTLLMRLQSRD